MANVTVIPSLPRRICVGVGDLAVSNDTDCALATYALGSCIGVIAYDWAARAGGILHLMLPDSSILPGKAATQPAMFADTGLPRFFQHLHGLRIERSRLQLLVAGGAHMIMGQDPFRIGESNWRATVDYLTKNGYTLQHVQVGGTVNRSVTLELATGMVKIKMPNSLQEINLGGEPTDRTTIFRRAG